MQSTYAQVNLVPNPGFELYSVCPNLDGQITNAVPWFQPYLGASSTDYFNSCSLGMIVSIPINFVGYQQPKGGNGYAGFLTWSVSFDSREYLEVELTDSLIIGNEYCVSFYVNLPENFKTASDGVGAYFSQNPVYYSTPFYGVLNFQPQVENLAGNIITDTLNWTLVKGSFIAAGGERYMTIGNFKTDSLTDTLQVNNIGNPVSYLYIDNVSVMQGSCSVGVFENNTDNTNTIVYPNPTTGIVNLKNTHNATIEISDASGRIIIREKNKNTINLTDFENGIYYLKLLMKDGKNHFRKIILSK